MNIAVITGGLSTERDVAISSGGKIAKALRSKGHNVVFVDVFFGYEGDKTPEELFRENGDLVESKSVAENIPDLAAVKALRAGNSPSFLGRNVVEICRYADITFFALHGGEGENGQLQAAFDILGIKYTGTGYLSAALAMDKGITRALFEQHKVKVAKGEVFARGESTDSWDVFPCVIKPCSGGSSVGIAKAENREQFDEAVRAAKTAWLASGGRRGRGGLPLGALPEMESGPILGGEVLLPPAKEPRPVEWGKSAWRPSAAAPAPQPIPADARAKPESAFSRAELLSIENRKGDIP